MPLTCADTALIHDDCFTGRMNQVDEMLNDIPLEPLPTSAETILSFIPSLSFLRGKHVLNRHAVTLSNKKHFKLQFSSFFFFFSLRKYKHSWQAGREVVVPVGKIHTTSIAILCTF